MVNILLIEDNESIRDNTSEILKLSGYGVCAVSNGMEGVRMAAERLPDLIICDIIMPELNGFEVFHLIKANILLKHIPFVFLTAQADKSELQIGMGLGANDYIAKPFDEEQLLMAVERNLGREMNIVQKGGAV